VQGTLALADYRFVVALLHLCFVVEKTLPHSFMIQQSPLNFCSQSAIFCPVVVLLQLAVANVS